MSLAKLDTGFNIEIDFVITPFHKRMLAWGIDLVMLTGYSLLIKKIFYASIGDASNVRDWALIISSIPVLVYYPCCEVLMNGQSIGKKVMRIQVISADGGRPTLSQYLIRWMLRIIDLPIIIILPAIATSELPWWCTIFLFTGIGCIILTPLSQRVGDLVAGTIIIDKKTRTSWQDTVFTELETGYKPSYPQVMQLSDKDVNTLKSIIESVKKNSNYDLSIRIAGRIKSRLMIQSDQDSLDFLETLLKDYNFYTAA